VVDESAMMTPTPSSRSIPMPRTNALRRIHQQLFQSCFRATMGSTRIARIARGS
jgi:fido (protein-threonine AMPylation protein)